MDNYLTRIPFIRNGFILQDYVNFEVVIVPVLSQ